MEKIKAKIRIRNPLGRALVGEFLGTAILVLIITCTVAQSVVGTPPLNSTINVNVGVGLGIVFGIAICAKISGGHINPAVSLMFLIFRQITVVKFLLYSLVQMAGAFIGAALAYFVYRDAINAFDLGERQVYGVRGTSKIFASYPNTHIGVYNGLLDQIVATAVFCLFIAHITDKRNRYPSWTQPLIIGTVFVMIGTAFAHNAGYPCNPARDLGPRLFTFVIGYGSEVFRFNGMWWFWVPIVGPLIGGALGGLIYEFSISIHVPADEEYEAVPNRDIPKN